MILTEQGLECDIVTMWLYALCFGLSAGLFIGASNNFQFVTPAQAGVQ